MTQQEDIVKGDALQQISTQAAPCISQLADRPIGWTAWKFHATGD